MCLSNAVAVRLGCPGDTLSGFRSKLGLPTSESPIPIPIMESCMCELIGADALQITSFTVLAWAEPPGGNGDFSEATLRLVMSQPSSTSQNKDITPQ